MQLNKCMWLLFYALPVITSETSEYSSYFDESGESSVLIEYADESSDIPSLPFSIIFKKPLTDNRTIKEPVNLVTYYKKNPAQLLKILKNNPDYTLSGELSLENTSLLSSKTHHTLPHNNAPIQELNQAMPHIIEKYITCLKQFESKANFSLPSRCFTIASLFVVPAGILSTTMNFAAADRLEYSCSRNFLFPCINPVLVGSVFGITTFLYGQVVRRKTINRLKDPQHRNLQIMLDCCKKLNINPFAL